jgi:hypothetical protein
MSEKISLPGNENPVENEFIKSLEFSKILADLLKMFAIFFVGTFFATALSDISGYIEDHNHNFNWLNFYVIFLFLLFFYVILYVLTKIYLKLACYGRCAQIDEYRYLAIVTISSFIAFLIYGSLLNLIINPQNLHITNDFGERDMLMRTIWWWLASILILTILINYIPFKKWITDPVLRKFRRPE